MSEKLISLYTNQLKKIFLAEKTFFTVWISFITITFVNEHNQMNILHSKV